MAIRRDQIDNITAKSVGYLESIMIVVIMVYIIVNTYNNNFQISMNEKNLTDFYNPHENGNKKFQISMNEKNLTAFYNPYENDNKRVMDSKNFDDLPINFKLDAINPVVSAIIGGETTLNCRANNKIQFCSFTSPKGKSYALTSKFDDENGRIKSANKNAKACGVVITNVQLDDAGTWRCSGTAAEKLWRYYAIDYDEIILRTFHEANFQTSINDSVLRKNEFD